MGCEVCLPTERGYTVYFAGSVSTENLYQYFQNQSETSWKSLNQRMFWLKETVFFDLMEYLEAHMDVNNIFAVLSTPSDPLNNLQNLRTIDSYKAEREASWIDTLIENSSICTHYQPIVRIEKGSIEVIGQELLSRGVDQQGDIIPPYKLFEAARVRNRLFALDRVCRMQSVKNAGLVQDKLIFINFIPTAIYVPEHCLSTTFELIKKLNIKPEQVVFEVVETDEVKDLEHLKSILNYYRSHGFKYALDDVGVGYNNLEKLTLMQPDIVKLAFEYTNGVKDDVAKQAVAKTVLKLAHGMNALALAEGVEKEEDLQFLLDMGYDLFQGYYFSKPQAIPVNELNMKVDVNV
ncbi:EAL domain-containing protein (putative c-di-GMP-specific phosphodiesterase class I) [Peribacillus deserti]|uniref:EAL domain-containing protein (Putative c-di-GMP-specific phosphodiesterase class I) n=1 Tax=Peribacillus deserti TaxID=673318 RepID=A0ABS2QEF7_9BACI|nr:EAL domain-containing protein [Peribacillus deserti]MBM7691482.1 EAL domain-containing protein (putative c-di-GMP-specific phosphodiesterase class I) [Peribacillus deserti]